jgi:hypothetical protein
MLNVRKAVLLAAVAPKAAPRAVAAKEGLVAPVVPVKGVVPADRVGT